MRFDSQPTLQGELVELAPLAPEDSEGMFAVASDPLLWEQHPAHDRYKREVFFVLFHELLASQGALTIRDRRDGRIIGASRYHGFDETASEVEIGWTFLARAYWGGKYNKEAKQLMLRHAFRFVKRVIFVIGTQNVRSQRAIEKLGGVRVGSRADTAGRDSYVYEIRTVPA